MNIRLVIYTLIIYLIAQVLVWGQSFAQIYYPFLRESGWRVGLYALSIPVGILFVEGTFIGKDAFGGDTWPLRFLSFVAGTLVFAILTYIFGSEGMTMKTIVTLLLCLMIIFIQIFWR